jgi:hypothetical protein
MTFQVVINTAAFNAAVERQAKPIMENDLKEITTIIVEEFSAPKSGRIYRRPGGGFYQASAPGEPPAIASGRLKGSITPPQVGRAGNLLVGQIRITAPYAVKLERGIGLAPRPFARPAVEEFLRRRV